ncbi:hypothetical protein [Streptomyces sp. NPDC058770]|uniref:hypothetical protein n=1 Tax=unclassified Streptomyces TaxID=2593676 RepID=UPI00369C858D
MSDSGPVSLSDRLSALSDAAIAVLDAAEVQGRSPVGVDGALGVTSASASTRRSSSGIPAD